MTIGLRLSAEGHLACYGASADAAHRATRGHYLKRQRALRRVNDDGSPHPRPLSAFERHRRLERRIEVFGYGC